MKHSENLLKDYVLIKSKEIKKQLLKKKKYI